MCGVIVGTLRLVFHIAGLVILSLATVAYIVAVSGNWLHGTVVRNAPAAATREEVYLTAWRRKYFRDTGAENSDLWSDYIKGRENENWCAAPVDDSISSQAPPPAGAVSAGDVTFADAFRKLQQVQAAMILAVCGAFAAILFALLYTCGIFGFRLGFTLCAFASAVFGIWGLALWVDFYTICGADETYCDRFLGQSGVSAGGCNLDIGYGFAIAAIILVVIGTIPLCCASAPNRHHHKTVEVHHHHTHPVEA